METIGVRTFNNNHYHVNDNNNLIIKSDLVCNRFYISSFLKWSNDEMTILISAKN